MESNFESNFFTLLEFLDVGSRLEVEAACTRKTVEAKEVIYTQGSEAQTIFIVSSGVVEVVTHSPDDKQTRSIGFMGRGDFFGDLAVLTSFPRLAEVRACEKTVLLEIEKMLFLRLLEKIPKMGAYFSRNLAKRLYQTSTEAHLNVFSLDLTGNLRHFDLLTIFQAITSMSHSGELRLNNCTNETIGSFFFRKGRAEHARFLHLEGVEAIWQGFVESATDGTFTFQVTENPVQHYSTEHPIELSSSDLLMQGVMRRDAFQNLPESLRLMQGNLSPLAQKLTWQEPESEEAAQRIWELIAKRPQPLASLWRRLNYAAPTFLEAVQQMVTTGQAEILTG